MRRAFVLLMIVAVFAALLSACAEEATPVESSAPADEITLRVFAGNVGLELELTRAGAQRYMDANPGVIVEVIDTPSFVEDRLGTYLQMWEAASSEGDVFQIDVTWPGDIAEHLIDLNEYGAADHVADHFPAIVENNTVNGRLVGIPWFTDAGLLYYRSDLLAKYDLEPPTTWDELEEAALIIQEGERSTNPDFVGYVWQGRSYEGLTCDALEWVKSNDGGEIVNTDGVITINNQHAIDALARAAGWIGTISPAEVTDWGEEDARAVWQVGNAAFMRNWPYAYSLGQADDSQIKDKFGVSALPAGRAGTGAATLGGWQLGVSKYSNHPEEAAKLAFFLASFDEQKIRAIEGSFNPTITTLYYDPQVLNAAPFMGQLYDVFINAVARPSTVTAPSYGETSRFFYRAVHSVLTGETDAETALATLEQDLVDLLNFPTG